uniref:A-kinase anchor protein 7-like phosphoesterase domain-containing protein n=1 Tax=Coccidioides posadasii RMSCC 3488 TaxID=454284 RepID=A0A0J6F4G0_COCPO|nr:hypothetical protein CPAG_01395 [Coccidioides posadasii RMSCC 3488]
MIKSFCYIPGRSTRSSPQISYKAPNRYFSLAMGNKNHKGRHGRGNMGGNKKPPLTHFLCLPLVNQSSATQLVNSLADFKSKIPLIFPPAAARAEAVGHAVRIPLVPDDAMRPLGTLHLTLGVMSLTTEERLQQALDFLQSLDLNSLLKEAGTQAESTSDEQLCKATADESLEPLTITLTSLYALPKPRSATILHAHPLDPTSRLYPFCVNLRNKFIEAGLMHCEMIKDPKGKWRAQGEENTPQSTSVSRPTVEHSDSDSDGGVDLPVIRNAKSTALGQEGLVPRPLLLHATISNTIYAKSRRTFSNDKRKKREAYKFDATELIAMFGDNASPHSQGQNKSQKNHGEKQLQAQRNAAREPYIWAKDILLDRICICEMGAKPVPHDESKEGPALVEEYTVVGEKRF